MSLFLSLGHNSSAIVHNPLFNDKIIGYEQERIDRIKSSSTFPYQAITEIMRHTNNFGKEVYVTHWFDSLDPYKLPKSKYTHPIFMDFLNDLGLKVITHSDTFTHHDAHASAAINFLNAHLPIIEEEDKDWHIIVADGFGNMQECVSVYTMTAGQFSHRIIDRKYGFSNSLGLMYQFATSFCGMKENQDEYKFLGYESNISVYFNQSGIDELESMAAKMAEKLFYSQNSHKIKEGELINYEELFKVKSEWYEHFDTVLIHASEMLIGKYTLASYFVKRSIIGFYIQHVIETYMDLLICKYSMRNVLVSGGLFYNVKLNNFILNSIKGKFCAYPLAGDQGAALGFVPSYIRDLNWGIRSFDPDKIKNGTVIEGRNKNKELAQKIFNEFYHYERPVNLFTDRMEFGPRALCNTSTLAIPTKKNAGRINGVNNRDYVMPFAPVVRRKDLSRFFYESEYSRVIGSDQYMIVTYTYKDHVDLDDYGGVMHQLPNSNKFTGRPQVVDPGHFMHDVLTKIANDADVKMLINTSCNFHGEPIIFSHHDTLINDKLTHGEFSNLFLL